jgi:hypothetical protein
VVLEQSPAPGFEGVKAVAFDGISSMQDELLSYQASMGVSKAGGVSQSNCVKSGSVIFGQGNMPHYMFAQRRATEWIKNSLKIPFLWAPPVFTALEYFGEDEREHRKCGPKLAGKAASMSFPSVVGNCLCPVVVMNKEKKPEWRLYLVPYEDETGTLYPAKHRATDIDALKEIAPEGFLTDPLGGPHFSQFNLGVFYTALYAALEKEKALVKQEIPNGPGIYRGRIGRAPRTEPSIAQVAPKANQEVSKAQTNGPRIGGAPPRIAGPQIAAPVANGAGANKQATMTTVTQVPGRAIPPPPGVRTK